MEAAINAKAIEIQGGISLLLYNLRRTYEHKQATLLSEEEDSSDQDDSMRISLFFDAGNVYNKANGFEFSQLRYSVGAALAWVTPIGPLKFSFGIPVNDQAGDELESFQFTIGTQ